MEAERLQHLLTTGALWLESVGVLPVDSHQKVPRGPSALATLKARTIIEARRIGVVRKGGG